MNTDSPLIALDFNGISEPVSVHVNAVVSWCIANTIDEVLPLLQEVWQYCSQGYEAVGWISYEAAPAFDDAFSSFMHSPEQLASLGFPHLVAFAIIEPSQTLSPIKPVQATFSQQRLAQWRDDLSYEVFVEQLAVVQAAIQAGEIYQANLTHPLYAEMHGDVWAWYQHLSREQRAGFSAFIRYDQGAILSCSPELFFECDHRTGRVMARPMKGTVQRAPDTASDRLQRDWLFHSEKNRAENVMIVDLLRNDLSKVSQDVHVPALFDIEPYPSVWQMTSTVAATLSPQKNWIDVMQALFPCGSVVGAPKLKTSEVIASLEKQPRGVYCGAVGWVSAERAVFNVPIRTIQWNAQTHHAVYGVGNGLTIDSFPKEEWDEMQAKVHFLSSEVSAIPAWSLLETLYWSDTEDFRHLEYHVDRLVSSAVYWGWCKEGQREELMERIHCQWMAFSAEKKSLASLPLRVRCTLSCDDINAENPCQLTAIPYNNELVVSAKRTVLAASAIPESFDHRWLCHKTTHRSIYDAAREQRPEWAWDILLWNSRGELTEFSFGNVALELDGQWYTPPISSGLLAGVARHVALELGQMQEKVLFREDIARASRCVFMNSLRGWVDVTIEEATE